jgi:hypothetical protein
MQLFEILVTGKIAFEVKFQEQLLQDLISINKYEMMGFIRNQPIILFNSVRLEIISLSQPFVE